MPVEINGQVYYRTLEACKETGISRATLLRWLKAGTPGKLHRDTRGWRLFTEENLQEIRAKVSKVDVEKESFPVRDNSRRSGHKRLKR